MTSFNYAENQFKNTAINNMYSNTMYGFSQKRGRKLQLGSRCIGNNARLCGNQYDVCPLCMYVLYVCMAIATVFGIVSALQIYFKMNLGEDGVTKAIVRLVGAILFIIGASIVLPSFFGYRI